ncbi:ATP F0F1 synthase subunit alpha [Mycoplasmoides fastidiosum]|uniref:ATP F0F1 synthase subunit alpha n=1 Tax=Mycoplasmoides fastidiosum TaxID=92758 RepID=UPI0021150005|nr:ATP F0F1 synthase subunit alpha [Mycoplasmoides fastidiosum]UUD38146.1 ATP F0F1 synthase subunit alpha [Mycoplasmoides fastidiosum]
MNATTDRAFLMYDGQIENLMIGDDATPLGGDFELKTKSSYFGTIIDIYGNNVYGTNKQKNETVFPSASGVFAEAKNLNYRLNLDTQLKTGVFAIDVLFPIGLGQRQVILGDAQTGKTSLCLSTIINNKDNDQLKVIYASIGNKSVDLSRIYNVLLNKKALKNTMILHAPSDNSLQQYLMPYVAMNHAENLMMAGYDVLVVIDSLTNHSHVIREAGLLTGAPVGKEAYPSNLFFAHAQFLERSGKFINGKSISCLPIVKTINNDITSLLASNVISITDGQIVLSSDLKNQSILPAIDLQRSVSRLGGAVQSQMLRQLCNNLNAIYNLYVRNMRFSQINFEFNSFIKKTLDQGKLLVNVLKQAEFVCYSSVTNLILGSIVSGNLLDANAPIQFYIEMFQEYMHQDHVGKIIYRAIRDQIDHRRDINQEILGHFLKNIFMQFEQLRHTDYQMNFNNPDYFKISPKVMEVLKGSLWAK